jgi:hypothetical protein
MKQIVFYSSETELWYPYNGPRVANEHQGAAEDQGDLANYFADRQDPSRLDRLVLGS